MNKPKTTVPILRPLLIGLCVSVVFCTLLLLGVAALLCRVDLSPHVLSPTALVVAALSALLGGWVAARAAGQRGWLMGILCGGVLFLILLLWGLSRGGVEGGYAIIKLAALTLSGAVGGVLGVKRKRH